MGRGFCGAAPVAALAAAYGSILASAALSRGWWSPLVNALSDLGVVGRGVAAAALFDAGLYVAGLLVACGSAVCCRGVGRWLGVVVGVLLGLVGVLNESFGLLHFAVAVALFLSMLVYVAAAGAAVAGVAVASLLSLAFVSVWALYGLLGAPCGLAVPETLSSLLFAAAYLAYARRLCRG